MALSLLWKTSLLFCVMLLPGTPMRIATQECHHYVGDQQETLWCAGARIQGGYEYNYNAGQASPCGGTPESVSSALRGGSANFCTVGQPKSLVCVRGAGPEKAAGGWGIVGVQSGGMRGSDCGVGRWGVLFVGLGGWAGLGGTSRVEVGGGSRGVFQEILIRFVDSQAKALFEKQGRGVFGNKC